MKKMSLIVLPITLLIGATSFAETYEGQGDKTPYGTQTCEMVVSETGAETTIIEMHALNQEVSVVVADGDESNFSIQTHSDSKYTAYGKKAKGTFEIIASGKLKKGKPVKFRMQVKQTDSQVGADTETVNCKF